MPVTVEVKMDGDSMADFMVYHIFTSGAGIAALILGGLNVGFMVSFFVRADYVLAVLFLAFAVMVLAGFPYVIRQKVKKQVENSEKLQLPITYTFDDEGIETITHSNSGKAPWSSFRKAVSRKRVIILYDGKKRAVILPVEQIREDYTAVVDLIYAKMPASAVKIRRMDGRK